MGDDGEKDWVELQSKEETKAWVIFGTGSGIVYGVLAVFYKSLFQTNHCAILHAYLICIRLLKIISTNIPPRVEPMYTP